VWLPAQVEIVPEQSEQDYIVSYSKVFWNLRIGVILEIFLWFLPWHKLS
jgi:hypothetical protein